MGKHLMSARAEYLAGLRTGYLDESTGILEPAGGYPDSEPYRRGLRRGRRVWRREVESALVVDEDPILPPEDTSWSIG